MINLRSCIINQWGERLNYSAIYIKDKIGSLHHTVEKKVPDELMT